jgi:hypothetical protein
MKNLIFLAFPLAIGLLACGGGTPPVEEAIVIAPQLAPETRVLDAETRTALSKFTVLNPVCLETNVNRAACQVRLEYGNQTNALKNLAVGNIIASEPTQTAPNGYLLRVSTIGTSNAKVVINATETTLFEALTQGEVSKELKLFPKNIRQARALNKAVHFKRSLSDPRGINFAFNIGGVVYDADGNTNTTGDQLTAFGSFAFDANAGIDAGLTWKKVWGVPVYPNGVYFSAGFGFHQSASIKFSAGSSKLSVLNQEIELAAYDFEPITVFIGPVPVVLLPTVVVKAYANGTIGASASFEASESFNAALGIQYNKGFSLIKDFSKNFDAKTTTGSGAFKLRGGLSVSGEILLYGLVGPKLTGKAYLELDAAPNRQPLWKLTAGISGDIGLHVGLGIPDFEQNIFDESIGEIARAANASPAVAFTINYTPADYDVTKAFNLCSTANDPENDAVTKVTRVDGVVFNGVCGTYTFSSVGTHTVTATATDSAGATGNASMTLNLKNIPPTISIVPINASFVEGSLILLEATGTFSSGGVSVGGFCALVNWSVTTKPTGGSVAFTDGVTQGCTPTLKLFGAGAYTISAVAKDAANRTASASINVTITASPTPLPPVWKFTLQDSVTGTVYAPNTLAPKYTNVIAQYVVANQATPNIALWTWEYNSSRDSIWHAIVPDYKSEDKSGSIVQFTFPDCFNGNIFTACQTTLRVTGSNNQIAPPQFVTYSAVFDQTAAPK